MQVVAVAGGTGGVGTPILEQLKLSPKYRPIALTRSLPDDSKKIAGVDYVQVDYQNVENLKNVLKEHSVWTVISTLPNTSESGSKAQLNLVEAANSNKSTERFIPSEYGRVPPPDEDKNDNSPIRKFWRESVEALRRSDLVFTRVEIGFFMDYFGIPHIESSLRPHVYVVDMQHDRAAIPGSGDDLLTLTYSVDAARFMVEALSLPEWPEFTAIAGDDITWNQFVKIAEEVKDKKFEVSYDSLEKLEKGEATVFPMQGMEGPMLKMVAGLYSRFGLQTIKGQFQLSTESRLNAKFPEIKPMSVRELLKAAWSGR